MLIGTFEGLLSDFRIKLAMKRIGVAEAIKPRRPRILVFHERICIFDLRPRPTGSRSHRSSIIGEPDGAPRFRHSRLPVRPFEMPDESETALVARSIDNVASRNLQRARSASERSSLWLV
jgi:hypothetical protein